jgi:hypothetical protein
MQRTAGNPIAAGESRGREVDGGLGDLNARSRVAVEAPATPRREIWAAASAMPSDAEA